jgi:hypothetical protein
MIKKKVNSKDSSYSTVEEKVGKNFINDRRYIILNEFVTHMRLNYDLSYTNTRAIDFLKSLNLKRKRVAFDTINGLKHSKNEFINELGINKTKPIITPPITHDEAIEKVALNVLAYIKDNFSTINFTRGIINFNMFDSEDGTVLLFDNQNLKEVLKLLVNNFSYNVDYVPTVASKIRSLSEPSYLRENNYTETSIHVMDKKFYSYPFKGERK